LGLTFSDFARVIKAPKVNIMKAKAKGRITSVMKFIDKY